MPLSTDHPLWESAELGQFWPAAYGRIILDETDSTMAEARRRAPELSGPTWIMARKQTAATGRRGRAWQEPVGNFAATLFLPMREAPASAGLRSFITSYALYQTLAMSVASEQLSLKWPNDVLIAGGKVAGILLESSGSGQMTDWLSIGIGVNLATAPTPDTVEAGAFRPVSVANYATAPVSQDDFLFWLASHFADHERTFQEFGFDPIRRLWLEHAAHLGDVITARLPNTEHVGTFEDVDADGNLVLTTAEGRMSIPAADVYF